MNSVFGVRDGGRGRGGVEMLPEPVGFATRWWCWKTSGAEGAGAVNDVTPREKRFVGRRPGPHRCPRSRRCPGPRDSPALGHLAALPLDLTP